MPHRRRGIHQKASWLAALAFAAALFIGSANAWAAGDAFNLGRVTITATGQPRLLEDVTATVTVIEREELETVYCNMELAEIISQLCGVSTTTYGRTGQVSAHMRGSSASQVLVLIDGRPVNTPSLGSADVSLLELGNVERIEVVRGPFSALYGSSALGGVINIITQDPATQGRQTGADFVVGSPSDTTLHLFQAMPLAAGGLRADLELHSAEGWRAHTQADGLGFSGDVSLGQVRVSAGYEDQTLELPGPTSMPSPNASQYDRLRFVHARYGDEEAAGRLQADVYVNEQTTIYKDPDWGTEDTTSNLLYGAKVQVDYGTAGAGGGLIGAELEQEQVKVVTAGGDSRLGGPRMLNNLGAFIHHEVPLSKEARASFGLRYDEHSKFGSHLSPRAGVVVDAGPLTWLRASLGSAFRAPTANDLYWHEEWGFGMGLFGNEDLQPEVSFGYELGVEHAFDSSVLARLTWFSMHVDQLISWVETDPWRWEAKNVNAARVRGVEVEMQIDSWRPVQCEISYQNLDARDTKEYEGKYLPYKPCHTGHIGVELPASGGKQLVAYADYAGGRYANQANTDYLEPYWVFGASLRFPASGVFLRVDNLLATEYQVVKGYPVKGTAYTIGIRTGV